MFGKDGNPAITVGVKAGGSPIGGVKGVGGSIACSVEDAGGGNAEDVGGTSWKGDMDDIAVGHGARLPNS